MDIINQVVAGALLALFAESARHARSWYRRRRTQGQTTYRAGSPGHNEGQPLMGRPGGLPPLTLPPGALLDFHTELRALHRRLGDRSLRRIAMDINRSGVSRTTVRKVFSGDGLPHYEPTMAVVDYMLREVRRGTDSDHDEMLDDEARQFEELWQAARIEQDSPKETEDSVADPIGALVAREYQELTYEERQARHGALYRALAVQLASRHGIQIDDGRLIGYVVRIKKASTIAENGQVGTD
ncbi:hypothetical protein ABZ817_26450 [Streptomyces antimycoticus]|uniref:hypothetical protein n=1 Tax=Streptomyces antimycoticus TaxID=68175 RepID=UPI0033C70BB9